MAQANSTLTIRAARAGDRAFVLETARRLASFRTPAWRTTEEIWEGEARTLRGWFDGSEEGALLIAERDAVPLGFVFLERDIDYFTLAEHGHVGVLAVTADAEGSGAGRALLEASEAWAREQGYATLTLSVFEGNTRARAVYERLGFNVETIRYTKSVR
jgi:GNAT superfamily N-acetyltransferase